MCWPFLPSSSRSIDGSNNDALFAAAFPCKCGALARTSLATLVARWWQDAREASMLCWLRAALDAARTMGAGAEACCYGIRQARRRTGSAAVVSRPPRGRCFGVLLVRWLERARIDPISACSPSLLFPPAAWLCDARPHTQPKVDTRLQPGTLRGCLGPLPRCSGHRLLLCRPCFCGGCEAGAKRSRSEPIDPAR